MHVPGGQFSSDFHSYTWSVFAELILRARRKTNLNKKKEKNSKKLPDTEKSTP
jgi:hypothetical protein